MGSMGKLMGGCVMLGLLCACPKPPGFADLKEAYIREWVKFYPSRAFSQGHKGSAFRFEDFEAGRIDDWIRYNRMTINTSQILKGFTVDEESDFRLLLRQAQMELEGWEIDPAYHNDPSLYAGLISQAMTHVLVREDLTAEERYKAIVERLSGINNLCDQARFYLKDGRPSTTRNAISLLRRSAQFLETDLPGIAEGWTSSVEDLKRNCSQTAGNIKDLALHIETKILPGITRVDAYGKSEYERKLKSFLARDLTPKALASEAKAEMDHVRQLMVDEAAAWAGESGAAEGVDPLPLALEAMEADRLDNAADLLASFTQLTAEIEVFIRDKQLATLADEQTLFIDLSPPHFSGASVGGVYPAGPFNPEARTLFYLPSIPDDAPQEARDGFYRSFNNHFNAMITAHEMIPGHYHQFKMAVKNPSLTRSLFADGVYVEGWGTFCEELALDAGWRDGNRLTRLAHLRKRMENAVRAYVSVMVHCESWDQEKMNQFVVEEGMLPPQFASNLWNRVLSSPMQLTTYYLGSSAFRELYEEEKARLGDGFSNKGFCDAVLAEGAVFIDALPQLIR